MLQLRLDVVQLIVAILNGAVGLGDESVLIITCTAQVHRFLLHAFYLFAKLLTQLG